MAFFLTTLLRKARLRKHASKLPTGLLPLRNVRSALVIADGTEPGCREYADRMTAFLKSNSVAVSVIFIDLRKIRKDTVVYVNGEGTITRRQVNWFGMPKLKKTGHLFSSEADLLINLRSIDDYTGDFISKAAKAKFKIGTCDYPGNPFDLIVSGAGVNADGDIGAVAGTAEKTDAICSFLKQII